MNKLLLLFLILGGHAAGNVKVMNDPLKPDVIPNMATMLPAENSVTVYEGMPNPQGERRVLDSELDRKKHFVIGVELFYEGPLSVSAQDQAALTQAFRDPYLLAPHQEHFCGSFHADYAVEWKSNDLRVAMALICFGCGEVKILFADEQRYVDLTKPGYALLKGILIKYHQNRPKYDLSANKPPAKVTPLMEVDLPANQAIKPELPAMEISK